MFRGLRVVRMRCIAVINLVYFYRSVVVVSSVMVRLAIVGMVFVRLCWLYLCLCTRRGSMYEGCDGNFFG